MNQKAIIKTFSIASLILLGYKSTIDLSLVNGIKDSIATFHNYGTSNFIYGSSVNNYSVMGFTLASMISTYISKKDKNKARNRQ